MNGLPFHRKHSAYINNRIVNKGNWYGNSWLWIKVKSISYVFNMNVCSELVTLLLNSLSLKRDQDKISPFGNEMVNDFSFFTVTVTSEFVFGERIDCGGQLFKWVSEGIVKLGQLSSSRESCDYKRKSFVCFSCKFLNCLLISSALQQPPRKSG